MPWLPWGANNNGRTESGSSSNSNSNSNLLERSTTSDDSSKESKIKKSAASDTWTPGSFMNNDASKDATRSSSRSYATTNKATANSSSSSWLSRLEPPSDSQSLSNGDNGAGSSKSRPSPGPPAWWRHYLSAENLVPSLITASGLLAARWLYVRYLRRIPGAGSLGPAHWRRRSLLGVVTSVGDGDGFRLFHTPGGRLAGWGWLPWRRVPRDRRALKDATVSVRLAGVDAPEGAHFGQPGQPGAAEAHAWLDAYLRGRRVRAYVWRRDQYGRAVATAVRYRWAGLLRTDVGLLMLRRGLATVYEAKTGAEFGGLERRYRRAERWARLWRRGLWRLKDAETPREYKERIKGADVAAAADTSAKIPDQPSTTDKASKNKKK